MREKELILTSWSISDLKENILALNGILWGVLLCLPGNSFASPSRVDLMSQYAQDWIWGVMFLLGGLITLVLPKHRIIGLRANVHALFWVVWLSIVGLIMSRSFTNGWQVVDFLITSPFVTLAFLHGAIYLRLRQLDS